MKGDAFSPPIQRYSDSDGSSIVTSDVGFPVGQVYSVTAPASMSKLTVVLVDMEDAGPAIAWLREGIKKDKYVHAVVTFSMKSRFPLNKS